MKVLYEDNHVIAIFKSAGMSLQGGQGEQGSLLDLTRSWLKKKYNKPGNVFLGVVHRLDKPVWGIVLFGKTSKGASRLSEQFRTRNVKKLYWALVQGHLPGKSRTLTHYLFRDEAKGVSVVYSQPGPGRKEASLSYRCVRERKEKSLLEIDLHTGRKHQIRAQLASLGNPIIGDKKYGSTVKWERDGIALVAKRVEFFHPIRQDERVILEVPEDLCPLMEKE